MLLYAVITGLSLFSARDKRLQTYIQVSATLLQQRHGLVTLLSMASQTKDKDSNYLISSEVTVIAEFLIIMDLERVQPKSLLAQALQQYKHDDISIDQMKSFACLVDCRLFCCFKLSCKNRGEKFSAEKCDKEFTRI